MKLNGDPSIDETLLLVTPTDLSENGVCSSSNGYGTVQVHVKPTESAINSCRKGWEENHLSRKVGFGTKFLSILVATLVTIIDNLPYGFALFPHVLQRYSFCAVSSVLMSAILGQLVFSFMSGFDCALGCCIVENVPFLSHMAVSITSFIQKRQSVSDLAEKEIVATILACYAFSSVLVGLSFFLLGYFKLGEAIYRFPRQVLIGGIGGMGSFLLFTGIGVSCGIDWSFSWETAELIIQPSNLILLSVPLILEIAHLFILTRWNEYSQSITPSFLLLIPLGFSFVLKISGMSFEQAREQGWMFHGSPEESDKKDPFVLWTNFHPELIHWEAVFDQRFTIFALILFSLLHVPLNIPTLSIITSKQVDIDDEFKAHAYSNLLSGCFGCLQNYVVLSTSALYYKIGGGGKVAGVAVSALTFAFFLAGPSLIEYIPRCLGGVVLLHLGIELLKESLVETREEFSREEYVTVIVIVLAMTFWGFIEGLSLGAFIALLLFVKSSGSELMEIEKVYGFQSRKMRNLEERNILKEWVGDSTRLVRMKNRLFFGNSHGFLSEITCDCLDEKHDNVSYLILDFSMVLSVDCSGVEVLKQLKERCTNKSTVLLIAALDPKVYQQFKCIGFRKNTRWFRLCVDINEAFQWCEDDIINRFDAGTGLLRNAVVARSIEFGNNDIKLKPYDRSSSIAMPMESECLPVPFLRGLSKLCPDSTGVLGELRGYFKAVEYKPGQYLWQENTAPTELVYIEDGLLGVLSHGRSTFIDFGVPGQFCGELSCFTEDSRRNSLVALRDSKVWRIDKSALNELRLDRPNLYILLQNITIKFASHRLNHLHLLGHVHSV